MIKRSTLPQQDSKTVDLYCPQLKCGGTVSILKCLYRCPKGRLLKCTAYTEIYPSLVNFEIEEKYTAKYGEIVIPIPLSLRRRRKRRVLDTKPVDVLSTDS